MPITRIRAARPVELEVPTTGEGDTVAVHCLRSDESSHEVLRTNNAGALNVAVVSGGGGSEPANRESWSFALGVNQALASYIPGATVATAGWPYYGGDSPTKFKAAYTAGIGAQIRLHGRLANGTELVHQAEFVGGECISPEGWAAECYAWSWAVGGSIPPPTAGQTVTVSYYNPDTTSWVSFMTASTDNGYWRPMIAIVPEGKKVKLTHLTRTIESTGFPVSVRHYRYIKNVPRSNQSTNLLLMRSAAVAHSTLTMEPNIEVTEGAIAIKVESNGIIIHCSAVFEMYDA
jgi:hypothetical protein